MLSWTSQWQSNIRFLFKGITKCWHPLLTYEKYIIPVTFSLLYYVFWGGGGCRIFLPLWKSCFGGLYNAVVWTNVLFLGCLLSSTVTSQRGLLNACLIACYIPVDCLAWVAGAHLVDNIWGSASYIGGISIPVLFRAVYELLHLYIYKVLGQVWFVWKPYSSCSYSHENSVSKTMSEGALQFCEFLHPWI